MAVSALFKTTFLLFPVLIISLLEKAIVKKKNLALLLYGAVSLLIKKADFGFKCRRFG